jgi:hypothetical protein
MTKRYLMSVFPTFDVRFSNGSSTEAEAPLLLSYSVGRTVLPRRCQHAIDVWIVGAADLLGVAVLVLFADDAATRQPACVG